MAVAALTSQYREHPGWTAQLHLDSLMTPALRQTLCDHAAGNYRILTTMAAELLAAAAQRELAQLDEKLYLEVFAQPETPAPRRAGPRR